MNRYAVAAVLSGASIAVNLGAAVYNCLNGGDWSVLAGAGLSTMGILSIRCSVAALCFFCTALGDIRQLKMHKKDFWLFAAVGILGQGMFSFCYYNAINMMSISTACILMYLSPVFVTIMARFVFKDGISRRTVLAIILCIAGCACVSGFRGTMTLPGLICGLGSAIAFALINILTRALLGRGYTGKAVNFWICAFAALFGIVMDLLLFREGFSRPFAVLFSGWKIFLVGITMALIALPCAIGLAVMAEPIIRLLCPGYSETSVAVATPILQGNARERIRVPRAVRRALRCRHRARARGHRFAEYRIQNRSLRAVIYPLPERRGRYEFPVL